MAKGHVGRPTNEEVAARKRKQILKVLLPVGIIAIGIIAVLGSNGLKGLMGNADEADTCEYVCEEGWELDKENGTCYQSASNTYSKAAYIIGDIDNNNVIDEKDYDEMETILNTSTTDSMGNTIVDLDERQEVVFDVDLNGKVNESDKTALKEKLSAATTGVAPTIDYVCPKSTTTEDTDELGQTVVKNITYTEDGSQCVVNEETKISRKAACKGDDTTEMNNTTGTVGTDEEEITDDEEPTEDTDEIESEEDSSSITVDGCVYDEATKTYNCSFDDSNKPQNDDEEELISMGNSVISKESNYLKYASTSIAKLKIYSLDKKSNANTPKKLRYYLFWSQASCLSGDRSRSFGAFSFSNQATNLVVKYNNVTKKHKVIKKKTPLTISMWHSSYIKPGKSKKIYILVTNSNGHKVRGCHSVTVTGGKISTKKYHYKQSSKTGYVGRKVKKMKIYSNIKTKYVYKNKKSRKIRGFYLYNQTQKKYLCGDNTWKSICLNKRMFTSTAHGINKYIKKKGDLIKAKVVWYRSSKSAKYKTQTAKIKWLYGNKGVPKTKKQNNKYLATAKVKYIDSKTGKINYRNLTVHKKLVSDIKAIFAEMVEFDFRIEWNSGGGSIREWGTDKGYSGAFYQSAHAYGHAVDINVYSNYCVGCGANPVGHHYSPGKDPLSVTPQIVRIWKRHGFYWGGDWSTPKDYMHFSYFDH